MGVEYEHYLVPEDPTFKPAAEPLSRLLNALYEGGYVNGSDARGLGGATFGLFSPEYAAALEAGCLVNLGPDEYATFPIPCSVAEVEALGDRDFRLLWTVGDLVESGLKYPLSKVAYEETYYNLEVHVARDYVNHLSSIIEPFEHRAACQCGQLLEFHEGSPVGTNDRGDFARPVFGDTRIHRFCPVCGVPFRPQDYTIRLRYGRTGEDLGPRPGGATYLFAVLIDCGKCYDREGPVKASEEFLDICQEATGSPLFQIGDFSGC